MSYTTMYGVPVKGEIEELKEYKNSYLSAPIIWNALAKEYLNVNGYSCLVVGGECEDLWELDKDERLKDFERILLVSTFDRIILKKENFKRFSEAIDKWIEKYPREKEAFHFISIKEDLENLNFKDYIGVCFNWTSVTDVWNTERGTEDEEDCKWDITKDKGHFFLFESLSKNKDK